MYCSVQATPPFNRFENPLVELARKGSLLGVSSPGGGLALDSKKVLSHHVAATRVLY